MAKQLTKESISLQEKIKNYLLNLSTNDKIGLGLLALILILVYIIRAKFISIPFERDEGAYAYYGQMILEGKIPYKDFYEQKLPGIFYFFAFIVSVFGSSVEELHTGFIYINLISIILIYFAAKNLFSGYAGVISAITFAIVSLSPFLSGFTIQSEHGVALFSSLGIYLYSVFDRSNRKLVLLLFGLAMGMAFMTKTSGIFVAFSGGLITLIDAYYKKIGWKNILINCLIYTSGIVLIGFVFMLLIYSKGSFDDMVFWVYELPKYYVNKIPFEQGKEYFKGSYQMITNNYKFFWYHAFIAVPFFIFSNLEWRYKLTGLIFFAFCFVTIVPGYYFYGHYWIQVIPGLAILSGLSYSLITKTILNKTKIKANHLTIVYLIAFSFYVFNHLSSQKSYYFHPNYDRILKTVYGNNPFPESMEIAKFLNTKMKPGDQVGIIGSEPQIYIYTKSKSPTRHIFFSTIVANLPQHKEWQKEFVADMEKNKPKYFIFFNVPISLLVQPNTDQYVFNWSNKYLNDNYKVIGMADLPDNAAPNYVWGDAVNTYKMTGPNYAVVFERKL
ncbi:MAG: ArnT family glycosyltransferase [Bacteroidia bacterium]